MRIADDTLRGKIINVLDQMQRIAPLMLNAVIAQIAQMLTNHRLFPRIRQNVFFRSAPKHSIGGTSRKPRGSATASGT